MTAEGTVGESTCFIAIGNKFWLQLDSVVQNEYSACFSLERKKLSL
jgi:hypothetical protein